MKYAIRQLGYKIKITILKFLGMPLTREIAKHKLLSLKDKKKAFEDAINEVNIAKKSLATSENNLQKIKEEVELIKKSLVESNLYKNPLHGLMTSMIVAENIYDNIIDFLIDEL